MGDYLKKVKEEMTESLKKRYKTLEQAKEKRKEGSATAIILDIKEGKVQDFLTEEQQENWIGDVTRDAIQITLKNPEGTAFHRVFTMSISKNSNLQKYFKHYGKYPEINDEVTIALRETAKGDFWDLEEF